MLVISSAPDQPQGNNPGFESPYAGPANMWGSYLINPTGGSWTFTGSAGVCANNSGLTALNPPAQEGAQVAFLQGTSQIAQSFSGFQTGVTYSISLLAAQRGNLNGSGQTFRIDLDSQTIGTFTPSGTNYQTTTTANFTTTAGAHTLRFVGLDPYGQLSSVLLDRVS